MTPGVAHTFDCGSAHRQARPIAEDLSLIGGLGQWVVETACRQSRVWQRSTIISHRVVQLIAQFEEQPKADQNQSA